MAGRVRPTPDHWQNLQDKILEILSLLACLVQQFMSLIGLLTATGKQVHQGLFHRRSIQWHFKNIWKVPESLEKVIPIPMSLHHIYNGGCKRTMSLQANHYTQLNMLCISLQMHQRKVECSLKQGHCNRHLVPSGKQVAYQLCRIQGSLSSLKRVPRPLHTQNSSGRIASLNGRSSITC